MPVLSTTRSAAASRSVRAAWAVIRDRACSGVMSRAPTTRRICRSSGTSTTTTTSNAPDCPVSTSSGISCTTMASAGARASISPALARTRGWMMASNARRRPSSANTSAASAARSTDPSSASTCRRTARRECGQPVGAGGDHLAGQQVRIDDDRTATASRRVHLALARTDASGQTDAQHRDWPATPPASPGR